MATPYVTRIEDRVHSTQNFARKEFETLADGVPVLVIAQSQDAGRGRTGNPWWNSPRSMLASVAMPSPHDDSVTLAPLAAGIAAHDTISSEMGVATTLKWPNDVMVGPIKVGGILAELSDAVLVVGCGINLWWPEAPVGAGGLLDHDPGWPAAVDLAHHWAGRLIGALEGLPDTFDKSSYVEICGTVGRQITWEPAGSGRAVGITSDGALLVDTAGGQRTLRSGEVSHVRAATISSQQPGGGDDEVCN